MAESKDLISNTSPSQAALSETYNKPFNSILSYHLLSLVLSVAIIIGLVVIEWSVRSFDLTTIAFNTMFKVTSRRLRCFNVDVTLTPESRTIQTACKWVLWIATAAILCFLWQSCFLFQQTLSLSKRPDSSKLEALCDAGLMCWYYESAYQEFILWATPRNLVDVCSTEILQDHGYITCIGIPNLDSMDVVVRFVIAFALCQLVLGLFQFLSWIIFRSKTRIFAWLYLVLGILTIIIYFVSLVFPQLFFLDTWFTSAVFLALPAILFCARAAGIAVHNVLSQQLTTRQRTEPIDVPADQVTLIRKSLSSSL